MPEITQLEFRIVADTKDATSNLERLYKTMEKINSMKFSTGNAFQKTVSKIAETLNTVDETKATSLARALNAFSKATTLKETNLPSILRDTASALNGIDLAKLEGIASAAKSLKGVKIPKSVMNSTDNPTAMTSDVTEIDVERAESSASSVGATFSEIRDTLGTVGGSLPVLGRLSPILDRIAASGKGALKSLVQLPATMGSRFASQVKGVTSALGGLVKQFGRIAIIKAIRGIISSVTKSFDEGIKSLYEYSSAMGTTFASSMDSLATSANYLSNSFAAMAAPIYNALAPALDFLVDKIVVVMNWINMLFAALGGATTTTIAKKTATAFNNVGGSAGKAGSGAKKAAKELKRFILAFDEINALGSQNSGSGSGGGGGGAGGGGLGGYGFFEEALIDQNIANFVDELKKKIAAADWEGVGTMLGTAFNHAVHKIDWAGLGDTIGYGLNAAIQTSYFTLKTMDTHYLGMQIAEFFNHAVASVNWEYLGRLLVRGVTIGFDFVIGFITNLDAKSVGGGVHDFVKGVYKEWTRWFDSYDWVSVGETISTKLVDFFEGLNPLDLASAMVEFLEKALRAAAQLIAGMIIGLFKPIKESINKWIDENVNKWIDEYAPELRLTQDEKNEASGLFGWLIKPRDNYKGASPTGGSVITALNKLAPQFANKWSSLIGKGTESGLVGGVDAFASTNPDVPMKALIKDYDDQIVNNRLTFLAMLYNFADRIGNKDLKNFIAQLAMTEDLLPSTEKRVPGIVALMQHTEDLLSPQERAIKNFVAEITGKKDLLSDKSFSGFTAKFTSSHDGLSTGAKTFGSKANFTSSKDSLSASERTISATAKITTVLKPSKNPTINVNGKIVAAYKEMGGAFYGGGWHNIPQYAGGTLNAGSMFIAGERGPEAVGHIGGRTEVLNASQLASVMYGAMLAGMSELVPAMNAISYNVVEGANGIIAAQLYQNETGEAETSAEQLALLREQNDLLRQLLEKDNSVEITTTSLTSAFNRKNQRDGKTIIPVGT